MAKKNSTSFDLTETTAPILEKLKKAKWDIKEVVNAGILMFSQAKIKDQQFFAFMATKGLNPENNEAARDMTRNWILEIVVDAISSSKPELIQKLSDKSKPKPKMEGNRVEQLKALFDEFVRISELPATPQSKTSAKRAVKKIADR